MSFGDFQPYVPVAARRARAAREVEKLKKKRAVAPVIVEGRKIAQSFWGKAWCDNLERYSDFASRLPRGRTYVRNGSVIDLQIERGQLRALVSGSEIYQVEIDIAVALPSRWKAICKDCAGSVGSLVELLQGKLSKNVMERVCRGSDGLFPAPSEIKLSCSCPDWADMCKHVAAVLYGVGARLDTAPDLLFTLRGVDRAGLVSTAGADAQITRLGAASERVLADVDVAALFGLDMAAPSAPPITNQRKIAAASDGRTSAQGASAKGCAGADMAVPAGRREARQPAARAARKAPSPDLTVVKREERAARKSSTASGVVATPNKTAAAAKKAPKTTASPGKASKAEIDKGTRRPDGKRSGRTSAAKRIGTQARKARG
jgi:uncharacterized Zn finger protein